MPRITMSSLKGHRYGGKWREPGDEFSVPGESDAGLLEKLGRARRVAAIAEAPVQAVVNVVVNATGGPVYVSRDMDTDAVRLTVTNAATAVEHEVKKRGRPRKTKPVDFDPTTESEGGEA